MKELYTSPEAKFLAFAPAERLASGLVDFDKLLEVDYGYTGVSVNANLDIDVSISE